MTTLSASDAKSLVDAMARLAKDCASKRSTFNIGNSESKKAKEFIFYRVIAQSCQELLMKAKDAFQTPETFLNWCQNDCRLSMVPEVTQEIIPFAMTLESEHLTELGKWLSPMLQSIEQTEDGRYSSLSRIRELYNQLSNNYAGLEGEKYREPAFYVSGVFRDGLLHNFAYKRKVNHAIANIIDDSLDKPESARAWIKKIHETYLASPETGRVIKETLRDRLIDEQVEGLEDLRDYAFGQSMPTGVECSKRCRHVIEKLFSMRRLLDLEADIDAILMNERYMRQAFIEEVIVYIQKASDKADNDYDQTGELPDYPPNLQNFSNFYSEIGINVEDLCKIAMMTAGRLTRGEVVDYAEQSPAQQMKAAMASFKKGSPNGYEPRWPEHAVIGSILAALPQEITSEVAQDDDYNRTFVYAVTGDPAHLKNMVESNRLDKIIGSDLGL